MDWTDIQVSTLTRLWQEGLSASHVARQLGGVSRNAVIGKVHRLGIAVRAVPVRLRAPAERPRPRGPNGALYAVDRSAHACPPLDPELPPTATMRTLTVASCRWPIGDPRDSDFGYCGRDRVSGGSYCTGHAQVAFRHHGESGQRSDRRLQRFLSGVRSSVGADWR